MGLGKLQSQARNQGASDPATSFVRTATQPLLDGLTAIANSASSFFQGMAESGALKAENDRLRSLESGAAMYADTVRGMDAEIGRLRKMLELPPVPGKQRISGAVIGYSPLESRTTLNIGQRHGVRKGMPVVAAEGLYGTVQTVDKTTCQVLLISSPRFRIVGMVQRDPPPVGFVRGQSPDAVSFEVLASKAVAQEGDIVLTSGFSERIPAGIPIGRIIEVEHDEAYGSRRCKVYPNVQVGAVREVFVLK